jgi:hypothetical protein
LHDHLATNQSLRRECRIRRVNPLAVSNAVIARMRSAGIDGRSIGRRFFAMSKHSGRPRESHEF